QVNQDVDNDNLINDMPNFGYGVDQDIDNLHDDLVKIYNQVEESNLIKFGIIDLDDNTMSQLKPYIIIKEKYEKNFEFEIFNDEIIKKMLSDIKMISNKDSVTKFIQSYNHLETFDNFEISARIKHFILWTVKILWNVFAKNDSYLDKAHSEMHISTMLHAPVLECLFGCKDPSDANKIRRNEIKKKRVRLAQIPDAKLTYGIKDVEVLVVEKAKDPIHKDIKKASGDQNKLSMLMHDQHTCFYSILYENYLEEEMNKINVFGLRISKLQLTGYIMHVPAPGLYVKSRLFSVNFPKRLSDMSSLRECLINLIKFRLMLDKSYNDFLMVLEKDDGFRTPRRLGNPWIVKFNKSPPTILKEEKENSK
ncbi:13795_t:CDS:2, partial [Entrophospora sp. SA101]